MGERYTGVDIGATAARAVQVAGIDDHGFAVISRFATAPIRGDAVLGGRIRNPQAVAHAVAKVVRDVGGRSGRIILGAAAPEAAVTRLALPAAVRPHERVNAIRTMGVQVAPAIATGEAALSSQLVREEIAGEGRKVAALVVAATAQAEIDTLRTVARLARLEPRAIDLAASGTLRALVRDFPTSRDIATIVDVGATSTYVITREGVHLRGLRAFPSGGFDLTRAIAGALREPFDVAERKKYTMRLPVGMAGAPVQLDSGYAGVDDGDDEYVAQVAAQTSVEQALAAAAENLVDQIAQAIEADANNGMLTGHVALCGGTALMRGLKERLKRRLGVEVRIGHPWATLERTARHEQHIVNGREDPRLMLSLATACGLALWSPQP